MLISIDHGNKQVKTVHTVFTSGLVETETRPFGSDVLKYNGHFYTLTDNRIPFTWDKSTNECFFILTLFGIAREIEAVGCYSSNEILGVDLLVGLPPAHYGALHERFEKYFHRTCGDDYLEFMYQDKPYYVSIDSVQSFPQAYAAAMTAFRLFADKPKAYVVDIGGMTVDYLAVNHGEVDREFSDSLESGVITLYNKIQAKVRGEHGMLIDDRQIDAMLGGEDVLCDPSLLEYVNGQAQAFVGSLLGSLRERKLDLRTAPTIFVGGGSILLRKYIEPSEAIGRCIFVSDVCANAKGYEFLYKASKAGCRA